MEEKEEEIKDADVESENLYPKPSELCDQHEEDVENDQNATFPATSLSSTSQSQGEQTTRTDGFNFWEVNGYKKTVKRIEDGAKFCDDLVKLISERAEIESLYAGKLQGWRKKWADFIDKSSEYGTLKQSWINMCSEANQIAQIHLNFQERLTNTVQHNVSAWKAKNYQKAIMKYRQTKTAEESFSRGQKPWAKKYDTVLKCKKAYFAACKARDQAEKLYEDAKRVENSSEEHIKKLMDRTVKANTEVVTAQDNYKESLRDIDNYNPKYKDDMCYVFGRCQKAERERRAFFKQSFLSYCQVLDLRQYSDRLSQIYQETSDLVNSADAEADLRWFAETWGTGMPVSWPQYEEYSCPVQEVPIQKSIDQPSQSSTDQTDAGKQQSPKKGHQSSVCTTL